MAWLQTIWNWRKAELAVQKLQRKIAVAYKADDLKTVARLQGILVNSAAARALAIKKTVNAKGGQTPGVDGILIESPSQFWDMIGALARIVGNTKLYVAKPTKRIWIPKHIGTDKLRPISIPVMRDRVLQTLYVFALQPIADITADEQSFGFRSGRGVLDALFTTYLGLTTLWGQLIYDADIEQFFPSIPHRWMLSKIPMDPCVLMAFLKAGFIEKGVFYDMPVGVPQGSPLSPIISNMVLDGLQKVVDELANSLSAENLRNSVLFVRYADDFIIMGLNEKMRWWFDRKLIPGVEAFLAERGLKISKEKTRLVNRTEGFKFLGYWLQWVPSEFAPGKFYLNIRPADKSVDTFIVKLKALFKTFDSMSTSMIILKLNSILTGWGNAFKFGHSSQVFTKIDRLIYKLFWVWAQRKYPRMAKGALYSKVYKRDSKGLQPFYVDDNGKVVLLVRLSDIKAKPSYGPIRGGKFNRKFAGRR